MKTEKEISKQEMQDTVDEDHYILLFEKKSARLFMNISIKGPKVSYSVFNRKSHGEQYFDLLGEAASVYNYLP